MGLENGLKGIVDLIDMKAIYNEGAQGEKVRKEDIPKEFHDKAKEKRDELIATLAEIDGDIEELYLLEEEVTADKLREVIRKRTIDLSF